MLAATMGDRASAEALLKAGANPNRPGPGGRTATSIARERKDAAMVGAAAALRGTLSRGLKPPCYLAAALTTPSRRPRAGCFRRAGTTRSRTKLGSANTPSWVSPL